MFINNLLATFLSLPESTIGAAGVLPKNAKFDFALSCFDWIHVFQRVFKLICNFGILDKGLEKSGL